MKLAKAFTWNKAKNQLLKATRTVSFEEVLAHITAGDILDIIEHPNQKKYRGQKILIVSMRRYAWLVPFVETEDTISLITIIPSRKATKRYLKNEEVTD
jgi:uncharacterized DUF497 family protein